MYSFTSVQFEYVETSNLVNEFSLLKIHVAGGKKQPRDFLERQFKNCLYNVQFLLPLGVGCHGIISSIRIKEQNKERVKFVGRKLGRR